MYLWRFVMYIYERELALHCKKPGEFPYGIPWLRMSCAVIILKGVHVLESGCRFLA